ncbi:hypothetical protein CABS03_00999 [Colletotrichum abscissum]|uniref:Uncharacterized protein n=2 Tax=Colletotrichum acutatum species complex TaxID=2707335 RepID=A0A9Q0B1C7_9PEZI|nr:hypothetical protein CABS02_10334 [Colletotrichum abscissum]KAK0371010.1 hypothetical protein CLIM01_11635 [Colletotrichum limetticola]
MRREGAPCATPSQPWLYVYIMLPDEGSAIHPRLYAGGSVERWLDGNHTVGRASSADTLRLDSG